MEGRRGKGERRGEGEGEGEQLKGYSVFAKHVWSYSVISNFIIPQCDTVRV